MIGAGLLEVVRRQLATAKRTEAEDQAKQITQNAQREAETLIKEAAEEAAIPEALASKARPVATVTYAMARPEGLRRDVLHCYDLELPEDFTPVPHDGEVDGFAL